MTTTVLPAIDNPRLCPTQEQLHAVVASLADASGGFDRHVVATRLGWTPAKVSATVVAIQRKRLAWPYHTIARQSPSGGGPPKRHAPEPVPASVAIRSEVDRLRFAWLSGDRDRLIAIVFATGTSLPDDDPP